MANRRSTSLLAAAAATAGLAAMTLVGQNVALDQDSLQRLPPAERISIERSLSAKDYRGAASTLAALLRNQQFPGIQSLYGRILFLDRQYSEAARALEQSDAAATLVASDRFTLAMAYVLSGQQSAATKALLRLQESHPSDALYRYWLARIDFEEQRYEDARKRLQFLLDQDPSHARARNQLALTLEALGKLPEAEVEFRRAVAGTKPEACRWPAANLASLLRKQGRDSDAASILQRAIDCESEFAPVHYQQGLLLESLARDPDAIRSLTRATQLDPQYAEAYFALSRAYRRLGKVQEAQQALKQFETLKNAGAAPN